MMTAEGFVTGRSLDSDGERELAGRVLQALTTEESAPDAVMDSARELVHVLVDQPGTWATGGPPPVSAPRYLVRLTVPQAWCNDRRFTDHVVPLITAAIAGTEPDPSRLDRDPHCVVQIVGLREHCVGALGQAVTNTGITRLVTRGFRESAERPEAPEGSTIDPVCGMAVEWATARFTLTLEGVDYAFCAPSCRKVFAEDNQVA